MYRIFGSVAIGCLVVVLAGCGGGTEIKLGTPSIKPLPAEYRVMVKHLAMEMNPSREDFRDDKGLTEIIAEGHTAVIDLRGIQTTDADLNYVANLGQAAVSEGVTRIERINALPKPPSDGEVLASSFIAGLISGDPISGAIAGAAIGNDADQKKSAIAVETLGLLAAIEKADAAHMMLAKIAEKYAATPSTGTNRFVVDVDESWGSFGPHDWLYVYNNGPALDDCTIQVQLTGSTGQVRKNIHFVRRWPEKSWMYARYQPGREILGRQVGKMTVTEIQKAEVAVWSPQFTTSLIYAYQGAEKDKDIAERCAKLNFTGRYQSFQTGVLWNTQRGCYFTLKGLPYIPRAIARQTLENPA